MLILPKDNENCRHRKMHPAPMRQDWKNFMPNIRDQGSCGSCWAISAVETAEARYAIAIDDDHVKKLFSAKQIVDCDTQSFGCEGGSMNNAFIYMANHSICHEEDYQYIPQADECQDEKCKTGIHTKQCYDLPVHEDYIVTELTNGPISISVDAEEWTFYQGGIMTDCGTNNNHGTILVGYNPEDTGSDGENIASVTIRNVWGSDWGEKGYIRVAYLGDTCGWTQTASFVTF